MTGPAVPALAVRGATKRFGAVLALDAVDLEAWVDDGRARVAAGAAAAEEVRRHEGVRARVEGRAVEEAQLVG